MQSIWKLNSNSTIKFYFKKVHNKTLKSNNPLIKNEILQQQDLDTDTPKPAKKQEKAKDGGEGKGKGGGWLGGILTKLSLRPPNQMILPDDKNPTVSHKHHHSAFSHYSNVPTLL